MTDMRKIELPEDEMVERTMSEEQRAAHQRKMADWRRDQDDEEGAEDERG